MKMNEMMSNVSRFAAKAKFKIGKHSPEILMVCGAVGAVTSAVMACKATLKVNDILAAHQSSVAIIHDVQDGKAAIKEGTEYTEEDAKKDLTNNLVYWASMLRLHNPSVESVYAIDNYHGLRNDCRASMYRSTIENCAIFKNILETQGIQL